jgi:DNA excision repair protein ERCC-1
MEESLLTPLPVAYNSNLIQVKEAQRGNPVLQSIRNVQWEYNSSIVPDYVMGSTCGLFISIKYHLLHPSYLFRRIKEVGKSYRLRVVICQVDVDDNVKALLELNKLCFSHTFTLLLAWSSLEAARYIETLKAYETKPTTSIQEKVETDFVPKLTGVLKNIRSINRTDVTTLLEGFGSFRGICEADEQQLVLCPGNHCRCNYVFS